MRLATWNVNSIRARATRVVDWLGRTQVDVLAVQETKCRPEQFPVDVFTDAGYQVAQVGHSQWNGVAVLSRVGLDDVRIGFPGMPTWGDPPVEEARALTATCGGIRVVSLYVPNGREPGHPHLRYKLHWLARFREIAREWLLDDPDTPIALAGDWNVAPRDEDVWDMAAFVDHTHVTAEEREAFQAVLDTGYRDVVRPYAPGPGVYTFWDYQQLRFPRREGMRIDFVLASPALADRVTGAFVDRDERRGKGASDHAPVVVDLERPGVGRSPE
jgi:exodeoxyribonuclease-3